MEDVYICFKVNEGSWSKILDFSPTTYFDFFMKCFPCSLMSGSADRLLDRFPLKLCFGDTKRSWKHNSIRVKEYFKKIISTSTGLTHKVTINLSFNSQLRRIIQIGPVCYIESSFKAKKKETHHRFSHQHLQPYQQHGSNNFSFAIFYQFFTAALRSPGRAWIAKESGKGEERRELWQKGRCQV